MPRKITIKANEKHTERIAEASTTQHAPAPAKNGARPTRYQLMFQDLDEQLRDFDRYLNEPPDELVPDELLLVRADEAPDQCAEWIWPGRIPVGELTLVAGEPGAGCSLLMVDLVSRVTSGRSWPPENCGERLADGRFDSAPAGSSERDGSAAPAAILTSRPDSNPQSATRDPKLPGNALLVLDHDLPVCGVKERLRAAGADLKRVTLLTQSVRTVKGQRCAAEFDIGRQFDLIEQAVTQVPDCRLVVVDRVCLDADRPAGRLAVHVRLRRLRELARRLRVAVVAVLRVENCGLSQTPELPLRRGLTAAAANQQVHSLWAVVVDRQDPARRMLLPWKNVWGPADVGFAFRFESAAQGGVRLRWDDEPVSVALLRGTAGERARLEDKHPRPDAPRHVESDLQSEIRNPQLQAGDHENTKRRERERGHRPHDGAEMTANNTNNGAFTTENGERMERTRNAEPQMNADQRRLAKGSNGDG